MPSSSSPSSWLDEAFEKLKLATTLEETAEKSSSASEKYLSASSRYFEACTLLKRHVNQNKTSSEKEKKLLLKKIDHYSHHATELIRRASSASSANQADQQQQQLPSSPSPPSTTTSAQPQRRGSGSAGDVGVLITEKASRANTCLSRAVDADEKGDGTKAFEEYMSAVELYLDAVSLAGMAEHPDRDLIDVLKRRLKGAMDRAEQLKKRETTRTKTSSRPLSKSTLPTPKTTTTPTPPPRPTTNGLTPTEIQILKRSSLISSGLFMPWSDADLENDFSSHCSELWTDPDGYLPLSLSQQKKFFKWARPSDVRSLRRGWGVHKPIVMVHAVTPYTIRQTCVTDCTFIASLCICAAYERRFKKKLVTSLIYPQDADGNPIYNKYGKYVVKLWLNGVARRVVVDDYFPVDLNGNLLCSHTTYEGGLELWVSLIEKAYMKLCGGYDFPGSNSGVDLFSLTGWIPERIYFPEITSLVTTPATKSTTSSPALRDFETPPERAWERLHSACSYGDCLITVSSSSDVKREVAEEVGLVTAHAYAVLNVVRTGKGVRLLQLKNPWAHKGWKGKYSPYDLDSWADPTLQSELGYNPSLASKYDDGVFWISWDDILIYFRNIHLSWNPSLFSSRVTIHGLWPSEQGPKDDSYNIGENPQYVLTLSDEALAKKASMWILISRHVTKQEQESTEADDFLTIHIYRNTSKRERIWYPSGNGDTKRVLTGAYTNNPHVLIRYDLNDDDDDDNNNNNNNNNEHNNNGNNKNLVSSDKTLSLVLSQFQKSNDLGYTMSCFCTQPFSLGPPAALPSHVRNIPSEWTEGSAGGPPSKGKYNLNPRWNIVVDRDDVYVLITCRATKSLAINVMVFEGTVMMSAEDGRSAASSSSSTTPTGGIYSLMLDKPVVDTGDYRHGFLATGLTRLKRGDYTLVVSTFNPGEIGGFLFTVYSTEVISVNRCPL